MPESIIHWLAKWYMFIYVCLSLSRLFMPAICILPPLSSPSPLATYTQFCSISLLIHKLYIPIAHCLILLCVLFCAPIHVYCYVPPVRILLLWALSFAHIIYILHMCMFVAPFCRSPHELHWFSQCSLLHVYIPTVLMQVYIMLCLYVYISFWMYVIPLVCLKWTWWLLISKYLESMFVIDSSGGFPLINTSSLHLVKLTWLVG